MTHHESMPYDTYTQDQFIRMVTMLRRESRATATSDNGHYEGVFSREAWETLESVSESARRAWSTPPDDQQRKEVGEDWPWAVILRYADTSAEE